MICQVEGILLYFENLNITAKINLLIADHLFK